MQDTVLQETLQGSILHLSFLPCFAAIKGAHILLDVCPFYCWISVCPQGFMNNSRGDIPPFFKMQVQFVPDNVLLVSKIPISQRKMVL